MHPFTKAYLYKRNTTDKIITSIIALTNNAPSITEIINKLGTVYQDSTFTDITEIPVQKAMYTKSLDNSMIINNYKLLSTEYCSIRIHQNNNISIS